MNKKKVVFLLTDALRGDYPDRHNMNFLSQAITGPAIWSKGVHPSTGFCEIIEYVLGQSAAEHGMLAQITAKANWEQQKALPALAILDRVTNLIGNVPKIRGVWRLFLDAIAHRIVEPEMARVRYHVPMPLLPFFQPTESRVEYDSFEFGGEENLFYWMKENGISYDIDDFVKFNKVTGSDEERFHRLLSKIDKAELADFTLLYIGYGELAHFMGTGDEIFSTYMERLDKSIESVAAALEKRYEDFELCVLGDHGMVDVTESFDVKSELPELARRHNLKVTKDFIYFLDSTCVRFWFREEGDRSAAFLADFEKSFGEHLELDEGIADYLSQFSPTYGDKIYLIKAGHVVYPDFFNTKINKGMHGYRNDVPGQQGFFLCSGPFVESEHREYIELKDMKGFIQGRFNT